MKTSVILMLALHLAGDGFNSAVLTLTGASCVEELASEEMDRFYALSENHLDLNLAGRNSLISSGLFTDWQVKVILRDRASYGDIMSFAELGMMEGFTPTIAEALHYFVTIKSDTRPGQRRSHKLEQSLTTNVAYKLTLPSPVAQTLSPDSDAQPDYADDTQFKAGLKYAAQLGDCAQLFWSTRTTYSEQKLSFGTMSAAYYGRRLNGKIILGNFAARFGQGLSVWSGFSLSGYPSVSSFRKNGNGIAATASVSSQLCGIAADYCVGDWIVTAAYSFNGNIPIFNLTRIGRISSLGLTATSSAASADWRFSLPDVSFFGEMAYNYSSGFNFIAGAIWTPSYGTGLAFQARLFPRPSRQYSGAALGFENKWLCATVDAGRRLDNMQTQVKSLLHIRPTLNLKALTVLPMLRLCWRLRHGQTAPSHLDLRTDAYAQWREWSLGGRFNALWCKGFAWLWYAETAWRGETLSAFLRGGIFKIDNWDDRIYVYERDAPGNFNVPAYYGRGWNASAYAAWQISSHHSIWLRIETVNYPWNQTPKPGKLEFSLQYRFRLY